jgi:hypothetical protein
MVALDLGAAASKRCGVVVEVGDNVVQPWNLVGAGQSVRAR